MECNGDFWLKRMLLKFPNPNPLFWRVGGFFRFLIYGKILGKQAGSPRQTFLSWWTSLLVVVGDDITVRFSGCGFGWCRWQKLTCDTRLDLIFILFFLTFLYRCTGWEIYWPPCEEFWAILRYKLFCCSIMNFLPRSYHVLSNQNIKSCRGLGMATNQAPHKGFLCFVL